MAVSAPVPPSRVMLDTNVLLAATDLSRTEHHSALLIFNSWASRGTTLYASGQIMREYLVVATRPADRNGLGLRPADALANARAFRARATLLPEDSKVGDQLLRLLDEVACSGKQIHDANVVATMLAHGIDSLATINIRDFTRFERRITLVPLPSPQESPPAR